MQKQRIKKRISFLPPGPVPPLRLLWVKSVALLLSPSLQRWSDLATFPRFLPKSPSSATTEHIYFVSLLSSAPPFFSSPGSSGPSACNSCSPLSCGQTAESANSVQPSENQSVFFFILKVRLLTLVSSPRECRRYVGGQRTS